MDRRKFFKKLFQSSAVVAAVPLVLKPELEGKVKMDTKPILPFKQDDADWSGTSPSANCTGTKGFYNETHDFSIHIDGTEVGHLCKRFEITHGLDYPYKLKVDFEGKLPYTMIVDSPNTLHHIEIRSRGIKYFDCEVELKDWIVGWDGKYYNPLVIHAEFYVQQRPMQTIQSEIYSIDDFDDKLQAALEKLNRRGYKA